MINPVTIKMPRHELETLLELAKRQLTRLEEGGPRYRQVENAFLSLTDALNAHANAK